MTFLTANSWGYRFLKRSEIRFTSPRQHIPEGRGSVSNRNYHHSSYSRRFMCLRVTQPEYVKTIVENQFFAANPESGIVAQGIKTRVNFEKHQQRFALGKGLVEGVQRSLILFYRSGRCRFDVLRAVIGHPIVFAKVDNKSSPPAFFKARTQARQTSKRTGSTTTAARGAFEPVG